MNKVVHFEIPTDDLERAKKFYKIFGWHLEDVPGMDYVSVRTFPTSELQQTGAINGGMMKRSEKVSAPVFAIDVESIDESIEKVLKAGGSLIMPKMEIGGVGYYAYVSDTEGNVFSLWEATK